MYNALTLPHSNLDEIYIIRKYDVIRNIYMGLLFINLTKTLTCYVRNHNPVTNNRIVTSEKDKNLWSKTFKKWGIFSGGEFSSLHPPSPQVCVFLKKGQKQLYA